MFSFYFQACNKNVIKGEKKVIEGKKMKLFIIYFIFVIRALKADDDPVVCLEMGCVRGKSFKGNFKEFEGFLGIPFAQPPVNELRLKVSRHKICNSMCNLCINKIYASRVKLKKVLFRIKDPQPIEEKWNEVLNATEEKTQCMQKNYLIPNPTVYGVEDCLYLYVYRPKVSSIMSSLGSNQSEHFLFSPSESESDYNFTLKTNDQL